MSVPRICVVGSESTGKTTLCRRLAEYYGTLWVPEYGREYSIAKVQREGTRVFVEDEFVHIARVQQQREDEHAARANRVLICDTDAFGPKIWCEHFLGRPPSHWPVPLPPIDLYLLPYPDTPYEADAIRDGEHKRAWMHERFIAEFTKDARPYVVLHGTYAEREALAIAAIDEVLQRERR